MHWLSMKSIGYNFWPEPSEPDGKHFGSRLLPIIKNGLWFPKWFNKPISAYATSQWTNKEYCCVGGPMRLDYGYILSVWTIFLTRPKSRRWCHNGLRTNCWWTWKWTRPITTQHGSFWTISNSFITSIAPLSTCTWYPKFQVPFKDITNFLAFFD